MGYDGIENEEDDCFTCKNDVDELECNKGLWYYFYKLIAIRRSFVNAPGKSMVIDMKKVGDLCFFYSYKLEIVNSNTDLH